MAAEDPQTRIRLPPAVKAALEKEAQANARSLNAEILARLQTSLSSQPSVLLPRIEAVERELHSVVSLLDGVKAWPPEVIARFQAHLDQTVSPGPGRDPRPAKRLKEKF